MILGPAFLATAPTLTVALACALLVMRFALTQSRSQLLVSFRFPVPPLDDAQNSVCSLHRNRNHAVLRLNTVAILGCRRCTHAFFALVFDEQQSGGRLSGAAHNLFVFKFLRDNSFKTVSTKDCSVLVQYDCTIIMCVYNK